MQFKRVKKPSTAMDMGPLLDCVFQLLIFFMLSSTFMSPKVSIALPKAGAAQGQTDANAVVVTATADGRVFVNQQQTPLDLLRERLGPLIEKSEKKTVAFRGDENIPYKVFIAVTDAARQAGAKDLDIALSVPTEKGGGDGP